jgi:two-component system, sensor histidine kinase PdtaS
VKRLPRDTGWCSVLPDIKLHLERLSGRSYAGDIAIRKILRFTLPRRFAGAAPPIAVEVGIGIATAMIAVALRYVLSPVIAGTAPYIFVSAAIAISAIFAGWRSGLIALIVGDALTLLAIIGPAGSFYIDSAQRGTAFIAATTAQLILLLIIGFYQREIDRGLTEREKRLSLLDDALREIDHRTRNNYQTVLALVELQARRSSDPQVQDALRQVADRIQAIASASQQLAVRSSGLGAVRLDEHLCELVHEIERGLSRGNVQISCDIDDVTASADTATSISIIVNELVTNAMKHAFNSERPGHVRVTGRGGPKFELIIADDGSGVEATRRDDHPGLGTRLVESFARQIDADHQVTSSSSGTTHRLLIPSLD